MATIDDINTSLQGIAQNLARMVISFGAAGRTLQTTASPMVTIIQAVGSTSATAVVFNAQRRAISFHNSNPTGTTIWVMPATTAVIGWGIPIVPGGDYVVDNFLGTNVVWNAIAAGGTNVLTVLEYV